MDFFLATIVNVLAYKIAVRPRPPYAGLWISGKYNSPNACHEGIWRSRGVAALIHSLDTRWSCVISLASWLLYLLRNGPRNLLERGLLGCPRWSGPRCGEVKNLVPLSRNRARFPRLTSPWLSHYTDYAQTSFGDAWCWKFCLLLLAGSGRPWSNKVAQLTMVFVLCSLTHWGRVTQICVFTLQLCKTDDANLRF